MGRGSDKLRGSLDLLILKTLRRGPLHGYGITLAVKSGTQGEIALEDGSLYPALHRLEAEGLLSAKWEAGASGRSAKVYSLTRKGRKALEQRTAEWWAFAARLSEFLKQE